MEGLEALSVLEDISIYEENGNQCSNFGNCCDYRGELRKVYEDEVNIIKNELQELDEFKQLMEEYGIEPYDLRSAFIVYKMKGD